MAATIPMRGRMIHGRRPGGELFEESQDYDIHGRVRPLGAFSSGLPPPPRMPSGPSPLTRLQCIYAVDRGGLNKRLLDILEKMPNVRFHFNHKLVGADFRRCTAWFEVQGDRGTKPQ